MRILVTGGCGFIGSNFINFVLNKENTFVVNLDKLSYCSSESNVILNDFNKDRYVFVKGDILSAELVAHILHTYDIEYLVHFAAESHVDNSFNNSREHAKTNVLGTHTLLEEARKYSKLKRFIHISTDEVYGESEYHDMKGKDESSILLPSNPYAASKAAAEMFVQAYLKSYKMPVIITRGNNVYGRNQYPEKLIPKFISLLKAGEKCPIHGTGESVRSFIHVDDTCRAIYLILEKGEIGEIYNIGSEEEYSVLQILQKLVKAIYNDDDYLKYGKFVQDRNFNDKRYFVNADKLVQLGWKREIEFDQGIQDIL